MPGYETSWFSCVSSIELEGRTLVARTTLKPGDSRTVGVCRGLSGFVFSNDGRRDGLSSVKVLGSSSEILVHRRTINDGCQ